MQEKNYITHQQVIFVLCTAGITGKQKSAFKMAFKSYNVVDF